MVPPPQNITVSNLQHAIAVEMMASRRYTAYATQADEEGYHKIASLFRTIADHRNLHAQKHLEELEGLDPRPVAESGFRTAYNVRAAIIGEIHECADIYPDMVRTAHQEGLDDVACWFQTLAKASRSNAGRFRRILSEFT
jgi:rubrerythrin